MPPRPVSSSRDPVCGMDVLVANSRFSTVHHTLTFHFCSAQCRDRFLEIPALYTGAQRTANILPIPKRRNLRIATGSPDALDDACRRIQTLMGVTSVSAKGRRLRVDYDLRQVSLHQIEAEAQGAGITFSGGLHALQRSLWRFFEHNELENAAHAGTRACCSRPPTPR